MTAELSFCRSGDNEQRVWQLLYIVWGWHTRYILQVLWMAHVHWDIGKKGQQLESPKTDRRVDYHNYRYPLMSLCFERDFNCVTYLLMVSGNWLLGPRKMMLNDTQVLCKEMVPTIKGIKRFQDTEWGRACLSTNMSALLPKVVTEGQIRNTYWFACSWNQTFNNV